MSATWNVGSNRGLIITFRDNFCRFGLDAAARILYQDTVAPEILQARVGDLESGGRRVRQFFAAEPSAAKRAQALRKKCRAIRNRRAGKKNENAEK